MFSYIINASRFQQRNSTTNFRRKYIKPVKRILFRLLSSKFNFSFSILRTPEGIIFSF